MKLLFIHQNFPAQFTHLASALAARGHEVLALAVEGRQIPGVRLVRHAPVPPQPASTLALARDLEVKLARATSALGQMLQLQREGFQPDIVVAHPGWGEALFVKDVWPDARLVVFAEFFYRAQGADVDFDPEFPGAGIQAHLNARMKNTVHLHALSAADAAYSPTHWQNAQLPPEYRAKTRVIFDGIDTQRAAPDPQARIHLRRQNVQVRAGEEVITFVNRNLEPYRGFHVFMRALPRILQQRPRARCLIVGGDQASYGAAPAQGGTWRQALLREVGAELPMERVHFLGRLPYADYLRVLQVSACHVYLTYPFVLSWSCLEAMSAARVVVGSRTGPVEEVITHGRNGLLVDFFDTDALARQVVQVLADPPGHAHLGRHARESVVSRYDLTTVCLPAQLQLIESLIAPSAQ